MAVHLLVESCAAARRLTLQSPGGRDSIYRSVLSLSSTDTILNFLYSPAVVQ